MINQVLNKHNWMNITIIFIVLLFFFQTLFFTWEYASPFVQADDWRFISLYLKPLFNDQFQFKYLWSDPVHPQPIYALFFVGTAKYFNLQIHYIGRVAIFSQLLLGLLITYLFLKSLSATHNLKLFSILGSISLSTIVFSFIVDTPYTWPIMSFILLCSLLGIFMVFLSSNYYNLPKALSIKQLAIISVTTIISYSLYGDWIVIFCISLLLILLVIFILEKHKRLKILYLSSVIIISLLISYLFVSIVLRDNPRNISIDNSVSEFIGLWISSPLLMFKSIGFALLSGLVNYDWFKTSFDGIDKTYSILSLIFLASYFSVLFVFFKKRIYSKTFLPPVMMTYSFLFILSVLFFRYNPVDNGELCLYWHRYIQYYQIGIIGYLWSLFLILDSYSAISPKHKKPLMIFSYSLTFVLLMLWSVDYYNIQTTHSKWLKSKYPVVSSDIRNKLTNSEQSLPGLARPVNMNIQSELGFLYYHKLNIFAPNYPYPELKKP